MNPGDKEEKYQKHGKLNLWTYKFITAHPRFIKTGFSANFQQFFCN